MKNPYGKIIHVIGFAGSEGAALLEYLHNRFPRIELHAHNFCEKDHFLRDFRLAHVALEKNAALEKGKEILNLDGVTYHFSDDYLSGVEAAETIFVPQSWYLYPENDTLRQHQGRFCSITRLYFDLFPGKIIGVTGSNGKTTTTNLIAEIMQRQFPRTLFSGNDRRAEQILGRLEEAEKEDWLVLEISNRQLMFDLGKSPYISVITNITPNHLNEYKDFEEYAAGKASLIQYQTKNQWSVLNQDDPESSKLIERDEGETMPFSTEEQLPKGVFLHFGNIVVKHATGEEVVMADEDFPLKGKHNLSNALAAVATCYLADVPLEEIAQTLRSVDPIPQRMELVETVNGVEYYNDSASTVPESTIAAIETLKKPENKLILILGGKSKGSDYAELDRVISDHVDLAFMLKSPLSENMKSDRIREVADLKEAVEKAKTLTQPGDVVLFSPAAEYFSYFKDKMPGYKNFRHMVISLHQAPPPSEDPWISP
ncbi:MAG: UDP-N-acetylmuramoyl-L-alanine--D-glutamate ligase [bacterium]|nr:UDP-N-acetylmuramoyl-L-alanine--D-glutamate ligase [bacterium]